MSTDFTGMIAFAQSLAETVKQAQTATEELAQVREMLEEERRIHDKTEDERDDLEQECSTHVASITALRADLARSEARNAEVSEALARANAKLNSFRELLGLDNGTPAPQPSSDVQPTVSDRTEPAHSPQHVEVEPAGGTGGVASDHAGAVAAAGGRGVDPFASTENPSSDTGPAPIQSDPTPAPEVAEPRPTPSANQSPGESGGSGTQQGDSWRDSASHVAYRPFSF